MPKLQRPIKPRVKKPAAAAHIPETVSPAFKKALQTVADLDKKDKAKH